MAAHVMLEDAKGRPLSAQKKSLNHTDSAAGVDRHAMLHSIFVNMDGDGSGTIDPEEFMSIFSDKEVKHATSFLEEIDRIRSDGDGDGMLTPQEASTL